MKAENLHVETENFIADVDLDQDGFGQIYYSIKGDHVSWAPQSEFLEINKQDTRYIITHQNGSQAGLLFKQGKVEKILDLMKEEIPEIVAKSTLKEDKRLLDVVLGLQMDQDELAIDMFRTIIKKQQFIL